MAYTALYRNFRPNCFSDVVGQDHITKTLKNQVISDRVGHAYLFTGGRGTGKTTSAKILARAVNCLNPKDGEPCNECEICKEILDGSLPDVVEMDAASNNGVEDIRSIREEVNFLPTKAKYRVYIIDEVHMLSTGAANALLKTLEEPPEHVKFILATTEPQKLPATILSRCQRFDFKKISEDNIVKRLKVICDESKINVDPAALKTIAILSEGHMRDAISILERCSQEGSENITIEIVKDLVGIPQITYISGITKNIIEYDTVGALDTIDKVLNEGKEVYNFLWELIKYVKDILVYKSTGKADLYSESEVKEIKSLADLVEKDRLLEIIYELSDLEGQIKFSAQKTIMFQTCIIKLCRKNSFKVPDEAIQSILNRLAALEAKVSGVKIQKEEPKEQLEDTKKKFEESLKVDLSQKKTVKEEISRVQAQWDKVRELLKNSKKVRLFTALANTKAFEENDLVWRIEFLRGLTDFNRTILEEQDNKDILKKALIQVVGKEIHLKFDKNISKDKPKEEKPTRSIKDLGVDINEIDE